MRSESFRLYLRSYCSTT